MEIVPTNSVTKKDPLHDLSIRKRELKEQIQAKQYHISHSTQKLLTPVSLIASVFSLFGRNINVYDGVTAGYKLIMKIKHFFKK